MLKSIVNPQVIGASGDAIPDENMPTDEAEALLDGIPLFVGETVEEPEPTKEK